MAKNPEVLSTTPRNYETGVSINTSISADFNIDLDQRYIASNVFLQDNNGTRVEGRSVFRKQKLTFTPLQPLESGRTYTFTMIGDTDVEDGRIEGLRNIIGEPLQGNMTVTFVTESIKTLDPPIAKLPTNESVVRLVPTFAWTEVEGAASYQFYLSRSNRFDILLYPVETTDKLYEARVDPNITWEDGIYYWKVRAVRDDGATSEWTPIQQFNLDRTEEGTISEEDTPDIEVFYNEYDIELELVGKFPEPLSVDIPVTLKSIFFRVIGHIDPSQLDADSFKLHGSHITGDEYETSHGEVNGQYAVVTDDDGTTYIIFTPDLLPEETAGED